MENREDLKSMLPYFPVVLRSSGLFWPSQVVEALKTIAKGSEHSGLHSGHHLFLAISDLRNSLFLSNEHLDYSAPLGYALYFDKLMTKEESRKWFAVISELASLLLRLPSLLELHYQKADHLVSEGTFEVKTGLRILDSYKAGLVLLSQELIGALLACSFFCLYPDNNRGARHLPLINFDQLFASLYDNYDLKQQSKISCIMHYFERICSNMPSGYVSFERKVLHFDFDNEFGYPNAKLWSNSSTPLCHFEVHSSGLIEDHSDGALEVDFANKYIGGGAIRRGCVQEEIRFMISPELIVGMLFLPAMEDNEAIEIIGAERFSDYTGYASSFRFSGDYPDKREVDSFGRRKTRIIAIDALCHPGIRQYKPKGLLREVNKAFCGFMDQSKYEQYWPLFQKNRFCGAQFEHDSNDPNYLNSNNLLVNEDVPTSSETEQGKVLKLRTSQESCFRPRLYEGNIGIATGNWGCGAFGGDPQLKAVLQWIAASEALRPFISYYTFDLQALQSLEKVSHWILSHEWTVGDLWKKLVEYSSQRLNGVIEDIGFISWLLPSFAQL